MGGPTIAEVVAALDAAAAAGPFFVLDSDPPPEFPPPDGPRWRLFSDLVEDPRARIAAIRAGIADRGGLALADVPMRSAASLTHLGLVARLVSPPLAAALLGGVVPDLGRTMYWREVLGPVPLALPDPRGSRIDPDDAAAVAAALGELLERGPVRALGAAIGAAANVSDRVLLGNVASATAGAVQMLAAAVPQRAAIALEVGRRLIGGPPLEGTGTYRGARFRRASCCLYYRVPGGGLCGDCVLLERR